MQIINLGSYFVVYFYTYVQIPAQIVANTHCTKRLYLACALKQ